MTTIDATLNGLVLSSTVPEATILAVRRQLGGGRRHVPVNVPGRAGSWIFPEEPGDRILELAVDLDAASFAARRAAVRELAYWADPGVVAKLILSDEPDRFHEAILNDAPPVDEWLVTGGITLPFLTGPYALASVLTSESITASANPTSTSFAAVDELLAPPIIEVTAVGGGISALEFTLNDDQIVWAGTVNAGGKLTISTVSDTVTLGANADVELTGAYNVGAVDMADVSGAFPFIVPGTNALTVAWSGSATSLTFLIKWRERFR